MTFNILHCLFILVIGMLHLYKKLRFIRQNFSKLMIYDLFHRKQEAISVKSGFNMINTELYIKD